MDTVVELFPTTGASRPLRGLYLAQNLRDSREAGPFVYTNFISSLDGRIATPGPDGRPRVPPAIINPRDWRLFHELAAQADVLLTSGRYLRDYVAGKGQDIFAPYDDPELADLEAWRLSRELPALPAIAVLSASLNFRVPDVLLTQQRPVLIFTGATHDTGRAETLRQRGLQVQTAGNGSRVEGKAVVAALASRGYRQLYSVTGAQVLHTLLADGCLHRLYLTQAHVLLGGDSPSTLLRGDPLVPPARFRLRSLYLDQPTAGPEQQLACFDIFSASASRATASQ
ncbi:MAG: RibD family protein [Porticoccaceae bacterium]